MIRAEIWRKCKESKEEELEKKEVELEKERKLAQQEEERKLAQQEKERKLQEENMKRDDDGLWNGCLVDTHCHLPKVLRWVKRDRDHVQYAEPRRGKNGKSKCTSVN